MWREHKAYGILIFDSYMKRLLILCGLLSFFSCTKDLTEVEQAVPQQNHEINAEAPYSMKGVLGVKLSPAMARKVAEAQTRVDGVKTRSSISAVDEVLDGVEAQRFERIFAFNPEWEAEYSVTGLNRWYEVRFDEEIDVVSVAKQLAKVEGVEKVDMPIASQYRRVMSEGRPRPLSEEHFRGMMPTRGEDEVNDPHFYLQWDFDNTGKLLDFRPKAGADINMVDAWQLCNGNTGASDIIVAVIDEPVYTDHPDLKANLWANPNDPSEHGYNFFNDRKELDWKSVYVERDPYTGETYTMYLDHGSHVAGVIAAATDNNIGIAGIAGGNGTSSNVKIMSCQVMGFDMKSTGAFPDAKAFDYALRNGAVIAQNSWGYNFDPAITPGQMDDLWENPTLDYVAVLKDAIKTFVQFAGTKNPDSPLQGGLVVFAAGNDGDRAGDRRMYPAADKQVLAVASMDWNYKPAYYTDFGRWIDITAPGGDQKTAFLGSSYYDNGMILSTVLCDPTMNFTDGRQSRPEFFGYAFMQGTSMACPHVSGVAALGLAYAAKIGRKFSLDEYKSLLLSSVNGIDHNFSGVKVGGEGSTLYMEDYKGKMGSGCVDALKLLLSIQGTPAFYVSTGEDSKVDLAKVLGGDNSRVRILSITSKDLKKVGLKTLPAPKGLALNVNCPEAGLAMLKITAVSGDTEFTREVALVSREGMAANGGWL